MLIGASMNETDLPDFKSMLAGNNIMRIFPVSRAIGVNTLRVLPPWTDNRFTYCREHSTIPFVSTKVDGDPAGLAYVRDQLLGMPAWITQLYITDRHEPEADVTPAVYQRNFTAFLAMVDSLPAGLRARIRCGPVLTKTWTERPGANRSYSTYDPGTGDFFAVDMYVATGTATAVVSPTTLPSVQDFVKAFKGYRKSAADTRLRLWAELGLVGMPDDPDGTARAAFLTAVYNETKSWGPSTTGWQWLGFIWWHAAGKATGDVFKVGQRRDFPLHLRTVDANRAEHLPGEPPKPVAAYNAAWIEQNATPEPAPVPAPAPVPPDRVAVTGFLTGTVFPDPSGKGVPFRGWIWLSEPPAGVPAPGE